MSTNQSAVEHDVRVVRIVDQMREYAFPHASFRPSREARMKRFPFAVAFRQIMPVCARTQNPKHAIHKQPIVLAAAARVACLAGEEVRNPPPLRIRQFVALRHRSLRSKSVQRPMNHSATPFGIPECRLDLALGKTRRSFRRGDWRCRKARRMARAAHAPQRPCVYFDERSIVQRLRFPQHVRA